MEENKRVCPFCGQEIDADVTICPFCGVELTPVKPAAEEKPAEILQSDGPVQAFDEAPVTAFEEEPIVRKDEGVCGAHIPAYEPKTAPAPVMTEVPVIEDNDDPLTQVNGNPTVRSSVNQSAKKNDLKWLWILLAVVVVLVLCLCIGGGTVLKVLMAD